MELVALKEIANNNFKQSDLGPIPKYWEVYNIPELVEKNNGIKIGPFGSQLKSEYLVNQGYKVYGQENVFNKNFEIGKRYINHERFKKLKPCEVLPGDFLVSMMGTIGKSMIVPKGIQRGIMDSHLLRLRLDKKRIEPAFLQHFFSSNLLMWQAYKLSVGGIMEGLSSSIIKKLQIPAPPKKEQQAIAQTLSDTDHLIQNLEKLIAKKRLIRQGAMQELLRPKEGWVTKKLGEVAEFHKGKGLTKSQIDPNGNYECIHYGELFTTYKEKIEKVISRTNLNSDVITSKSNDVLMPTSDVTPNGLATASCIKEDNVILGGDILITRLPKSDFNGTFLAYYITQNKGKVMKLVSGTTVYHLYGSELAELEFSFPQIEKQNYIVEVLTNMDSEIEALETKLANYRQIKQGMMQQLLTGKIRLVDTAKAEEKVTLLGTDKAKPN